MPVEVGELLHVLAHELRTPVGIAHGYVRLLLEDRLPQEVDRRRALEQLQKALARLTDLSHESSALANWFERDARPPARVRARELMDTVGTTSFEGPIVFDAAALPEQAAIAVSDRAELDRALAAMVRATARELRGRPCRVTAHADGPRLEVLIGDPEQLGALAGGPDSPDVEPLQVDRGGLGLALVHASAVLEAHGGTTWSMKGSRQAVGIRLPLAELNDRIRTRNNPGCTSSHRRAASGSVSAP